MLWIQIFAHFYIMFASDCTQWLSLSGISFTGSKTEELML